MNEQNNNKINENSDEKFDLQNTDIENESEILVELEAERLQAERERKFFKFLQGCSTIGALIITIITVLLFLLFK